MTCVVAMSSYGYRRLLDVVPAGRVCFENGKEILMARLAQDALNAQKRDLDLKMHLHCRQ